MPKPQTFPYLFDELKNINISTLIKLKYLIKGQTKSGVLTWRNRHNEVTGRITINVHFTQSKQVLNLDYKTEDEIYNVNINLASIPSNLGKGLIWFFICPYTFKKCRILHLIQGKFIHRSALKTGMYSKQYISKEWRQVDRVYGSYFDLDNYYEELYKKHFKKFYNGKPTKRYLKLMNKIAKAERISVTDIERLMAV